MINPDMKELIFSFLIADVTITLFMILLSLHNRKKYRGLDAWVAAFILQNLAVILIVIRGLVPDWISIVLSNAMIVAGLIAGLKGMASFTGVRLNQSVNYLILILFTCIEIWFTLINLSLAARTLNLAIAMVIISGQYIWLVFFKTRGIMRQLTAGIGAVYIGYAVVNLVRIINFLAGNSDSNDYFNASFFEKAVFVAYQVLFIFLAYSLALMYNQGLHVELASQEEKFAKAFNSSPYAILITRHSDGTILEINRGFTAVTGYSYEEAIGRTTHQLNLWMSDEDRKEFIGEVALGAVVEMQKHFRIKSGEIITGLISAEPIVVNGEKLILASINDISLQLENESLLQEKIADLERFNKSMTGRELRMIELKNEVNDLCSRLGLEKRYLN